VEEILRSLSSNTCRMPPDKSNVQDQAATPGIDLAAGSTAALPNLEVSAERLSDRSAAGVNRGTFRSCCPAELPAPHRSDRFLCLIFKREDFLLSVARRGDSEEADKQLVKPTASFIAPQRSCAALEDFGSSKTSFHSSYKPSPCEPKEIEVHNDAYACQNLFATWSSYPEMGNGFSISSIFDDTHSDNHPHDAQKTESQDLLLPPWCLRIVNTRSGPNSAHSTFAIHSTATALIENGSSQEEIFGEHPNIAALYCKEDFKRSPMLSQWAASMVHSIRLEGLFFPISLDYKRVVVNITQGMTLLASHICMPFGISCVG
jgi:hypothetical protein